MTYNTNQRNTLLKYLEIHTDEIIPVSQIIDSMLKENISKSAVYRNLAFLEDEGKLKRVSKPGTITTYYQYLDDDCQNSIHLTCSVCGKTEHLSISNELKIEKAIKSNQDFIVDKKETIIYGVCGKCHDAMEAKK